MKHILILVLFFSVTSFAQIAGRPSPQNGNEYHGTNYHLPPPPPVRVRTSPSNWNVPCARCKMDALVGFNVQMGQNCRYPNGNFQAQMGKVIVDLIPASDEVAQALDHLADSSFKVSGSVLSSQTVALPRGNGTVETMTILVREVFN